MGDCPDSNTKALDLAASTIKTGDCRHRLQITLILADFQAEYGDI